jgi:hypothetical protein
MKFFSQLAASVTLTMSLSSAVLAQHYTQVNLDANVSGVAEATDAQLVNGWGLARGSGSVWWVSDEATGLATLYDGPGTKQTLVVTIQNPIRKIRHLQTVRPQGSSPTAAKRIFFLHLLSLRFSFFRLSMEPLLDGIRLSVSHPAVIRHRRMQSQLFVLLMAPASPASLPHPSMANVISMPRTSSKAASTYLITHSSWLS